MSATMAKRGGGFWIRVARGVLALLVLAAGGLAVWYRQAYHVWPGEGAAARVHRCGRDCQAGGRPQTWRQITSKAPWPVRAVGWYPPLGMQKPLGCEQHRPAAQPCAAHWRAVA